MQVATAAIAAAVFFAGTMGSVAAVKECMRALERLFTQDEASASAAADVVEGHVISMARQEAVSKATMKKLVLEMKVRVLTEVWRCERHIDWIG